MELSGVGDFQFAEECWCPLQELGPGLVDGNGLLVLSAHPDDVVVGAGGQIPHWTGAIFAHVTDGAASDMMDAMRLGFEQRESYAQARLQELQSALALGEIKAFQVRELGFTDRETPGQLLQLVERCLELVRSLRPVVILTHPYEGGHPDHDSTAFAVQTLSKMLKQAGEQCPAIIEMTSYHNEAGSMQTRQFLSSASRRPVSCVLTAEQRLLKKEMFDCFTTQRSVLQWFPIDVESFRFAPDYDFLRPPHSGRLYYESFNWGTTGEKWRELAAEALERLGFPEPLPAVEQREVETWWRMAG